MLSWFKKRKTRNSKIEKEPEIQNDDQNVMETQKTSHHKKKGKLSPTIELQQASVEVEKVPSKNSDGKKKPKRKHRKPDETDDGTYSPRSEKDKSVSEKVEDPEEQEDATMSPTTTDSAQEDADDICQQDDHNEDEVEDSENEDFVGDYEFDETDTNDVADFACLSPSDIVKEQNRMIKEVAELLVVTDTVAGNLLRHFKWRQEQLLAAYFENPKAVLREIGQTIPRKSKKKSTLKTSSTSASSNSNGLHLHTAKLSGEIECLACADDVDASECTALQCEHAFCNTCWADYLSMKITEGAVEKLTCPGMNCKSIVPGQLVGALVTPPIFEKYLRFMTKSFVESNAKCTWCPAPNCGNAITAEMVRNQEGNTVKCSCGYSFCFSCHNEAHSPATCEHVRLWAAKCRDDSETSHWLGANTKDCPRCHVAVEKNGGCMHMVCRSPGCNHEWCWLCTRPWKGHNDYYSCNRYEKAQKAKAEKRDSKKKSKLQKLEEEREQQRQQLTRYLHYYERYLSHDAASKMEKQIKEKAYQKMAELESEHSTRTEVQFIERASYALLECHNTLKWSYVYAYHLPEEGAQKHLFNYLQQELEKTTEKLAELLEAPSSIMPLKRLEAVDLTALAQTKRANLLKGVVHDEYTNTL